MATILSLLLSLGILVSYNHAICNLDPEARLPSPVFANPPGSLTTQPLSVTLTSSSTNQIFYTTDGTNPSFNSPLYEVNETILIDRTMTIKAFAYCGNQLPPSVISTFNYKIYFPTGNPPLNFVNSEGIEFLLVPPMEQSQEAFYISKYEITQSQWQSLMLSNPSQFINLEGPVEQVNYNIVQSYITRLNERESTNRYSLPSKSEWIHAASAGNPSRYHFGDENSLLQFFAWYGLNTTRPRSRGGKLPNSWGFYDFHGNVREWVKDDYEANTGYRFSMNCSYSNRSTRACFTQSFSLNPVYYSSPNLGFRLKAKSLYNNSESPFLRFQKHIRNQMNTYE